MSLTHLGQKRSKESLKKYKDMFIEGTLHEQIRNNLSIKMNNKITDFYELSEHQWVYTNAYVSGKETYKSL